MPGSGGSDRTPSACCRGRGDRPGLRPRSPGAGHRDLRGRAARHPRSRGGRGPGARARRRPGALQLRPRPDPAHPLRGPGPDPPGPGAPTGRRGPRRPLSATVPGPGLGELARHWFSATQPIDLAKAIDYSRQAGDAALAALAPADALATTRRRSTSTPKPRTPIRSSALDLAHRARDRPTPDRRPGVSRHPPRRRPPSGRPRRHRTPRRRRPGQRPRVLQRVGAVDADKVEILELALERLPAENPDRALVLATLCTELTFGSGLERREGLADEAVAIAEPSATTPRSSGS